MSNYMFCTLILKYSFNKARRQQMIAPEEQAVEGAKWNSGAVRRQFAKEHPERLNLFAPSSTLGLKGQPRGSPNHMDA
jgi:hypothetical protein